MKAYMSIPTWDRAILSYGRSEEMAVIEARRILAETHPAEREIMAGDASMCPVAALPESIRERMAESLAAFVAE